MDSIFKTISFIELSFYQMYLLFCIWSFVGWVIEVCDMTYETGEYQNRGFLNMPICPIYGFGVLMLTVFFRPLMPYPVVLFFACAILCTTFELAVGLLMEKLFHSTWWDYSNKKFNFKGYICLGVSLFWGFGGVFVVEVVESAMERAVNALPQNIGVGIIIVMSVLILIDLIASVMAALKLKKKKIQRLDELSQLMLAGSVRVGKQLASGTIKLMEIKNSTVNKIQDINNAGYDKMKDEYDKLKEEYDNLLSERDAPTDRLIKAFPRLKSTIYPEALDKLKLKTYGKVFKAASDSDDENIGSEDESSGTSDENVKENSAVH